MWVQVKQEQKHKHIKIDKEVWKTLHELKLQWDKQNISQVVKELLKRAKIGA